jgi:hypothetical protein
VGTFVERNIFGLVRRFAIMQHAVAALPKRNSVVGPSSNGAIFPQQSIVAAAKPIFVITKFCMLGSIA